MTVLTKRQLLVIGNLEDEDQVKIPVIVYIKHNLSDYRSKQPESGMGDRPPRGTDELKEMGDSKHRKTAFPSEAESNTINKL